MNFAILIATIVLAFVLDFINGYFDAANSIAAIEANSLTSSLFIRNLFDIYS